MISRPFLRCSIFPFLSPPPLFNVQCWCAFVWAPFTGPSKLLKHPQALSSPDSVRPLPTQVQHLHLMPLVRLPHGAHSHHMCPLLQDNFWRKGNSLNFFACHNVRGDAGPPCLGGFTEGTCSLGFSGDAVSFSCACVWSLSPFSLPVKTTWHCPCPCLRPRACPCVLPMLRPRPIAHPCVRCRGIIHQTDKTEGRCLAGCVSWGGCSSHPPPTPLQGPPSSGGANRTRGQGEPRGIPPPFCRSTQVPSDRLRRERCGQVHRPQRGHRQRVAPPPPSLGHGSGWVGAVGTALPIFTLPRTRVPDPLQVQGPLQR